MPRPNEGRQGWFGWLRGFRTSYDKVPSMVETSVQTERTRSTVPIPRPRTIRLPGPEDAQEEGEIGYSSPDFRAQVAAAKLMGILWAKEPSQVRLDQSLYGAAFVLPQIARSAGWPKMLRVLVIKTWVVLFLNYAVQFAVLYMIAKENMVWDLFSGQMYLCDFGRDAESCPDGPNCIGPGGTVFTNTRYYGWGQWSTRTYARDAFKAMFPEFSPEISKYSDPGEYGVESSTCRVLCCALFIVTVLSDLLGSFNLAFIMNSVPSQDDLWIDWDPPGGDWASKEYAKKVTGSNEMDFVKLKIAGMPFHWKVLNWLLILLPKLCLWKVTTEAGICFLMETQGIEDVVVNSVALSFILQIDELLCQEMMNEKVHQILAKLEVHLLDEGDNIHDLERMTDQGLYEKNQQEIVGRWNPRDLWSLVPMKLLTVGAITWGFVYRYYATNCVHNEADGLVSKPLGLPVSTNLPVSSAFLQSFFPPPREEKFFWSMPPIPDHVQR
ncbi:unnamed protein product [Effrenium voratum]|uniref:Uncharacterized protein n=1 Tax=Effrenium voratum TaxID=2562239 RepID=A0AA36J140_9DINO|nr:unnamed protein product [Effrenium voratum]CAJ1396585.1 unnamed protein product [Effrenium voratum]